MLYPTKNRLTAGDFWSICWRSLRRTLTCTKSSACWFNGPWIARRRRLPWKMSNPPAWATCTASYSRYRCIDRAHPRSSLQVKVDQDLSFTCEQLEALFREVTFWYHVGICDSDRVDLFKVEHANIPDESVGRGHYWQKYFTALIEAGAEEGNWRALKADVVAPKNAGWVEDYQRH